MSLAALLIHARNAKTICADGYIAVGGRAQVGQNFMASVLSMPLTVGLLVTAVVHNNSAYPPKNESMNIHRSVCGAHKP